MKVAAKTASSSGCLVSQLGASQSQRWQEHTSRLLSITEPLWLPSQLLGALYRGSDPHPVGSVGARRLKPAVKLLAKPGGVKP